MYKPESKDKVFKWITERGYSIDVVEYLNASQHRLITGQRLFASPPKANHVEKIDLKPKYMSIVLFYYFYFLLFLPNKNPQLVRVGGF